MLYSIRHLILRPLTGWGFLATGLLIRGLYIEPKNVELSYHRIYTPKLKEKIRVVHLTDLHFESDRRRDHVPKMVNDQNPDLILMTGDYLNRSRAFSRLRGFIDQLDCARGVYASFGNWDVGKEDVLFKGTKVTPLRDKSLEVKVNRDKVRLVGIDLTGVRSTESILKDLDRNTFSILLHHYPDLIEEIAPYETIDLYLAGHTHGGQVRIPFLRGLKDGFKGRFPYAGAVMALSKFGTKYESGRFQVGETTLYVNRGVGMEGGLVPRIRLFCQPEIAVFDITPQSIRRRGI